MYPVVCSLGDDLRRSYIVFPMFAKTEEFPEPLVFQEDLAVSYSDTS
jgi:hypothetical protein